MAGAVGDPVVSVPAIRVMRTVNVVPQDARNTMRSMRVLLAAALGIFTSTDALLLCHFPSTIAPPVFTATVFAPDTVPAYAFRYPGATPSNPEHALNIIEAVDQFACVYDVT